MIVVVEGVSAAGKTLWASRYAPAVVDEIAGDHPPSDDVAAVGRYWSDRHSERWRRGLDLERVHDVVCFDTDPLKMHYPWCLWQSGQGTREAWRANVEASRARIAQERLGFADRIVFLDPPEEVVRCQKVNDTMRRRSNFEMHLRLHEPLRRWYRMLEALSPGRVVTDAHPGRRLLPAMPRPDRYNLQLFDALVDAADRPAA